MEDKYLKFNTEKKKSEKKVTIGGLIAALGIILVVAGQTQQGALFVAGIFIALGGLVFLAIGFAGFTKLKKTFKVEVLAKMFQEAIPDIQYSPNSGLGQQDVYSTDFLKRADRFHTEDLLSGSIENVNFISSDVKLEERHVQHTKNGTRVYYVTYFLGRVFKFDFNKEFVGSLHVLESGSPRSKGFKKVKLESIQFNKTFKTFSTEDITAFYILTPPIMEAINAIEKRHPGRIGFSFRGDHMYVAINNNKDTFEVQMFRKIDDSMIEEFKKDLLMIKDLIITLKLNKNLFKK
jgi:hypothetical protein